MKTRLRLTASDRAQLITHLFPGDEKEAVAFGLCGRHHHAEGDLLFVHQVHPIPHDDCPIRKRDLVTWQSGALEPLLERAAKKRLGIVKFHSHPTDFRNFSPTDDQSDRDLFPSVHGWVDDNRPHASVVMLPSGDMIGRDVSDEGEFRPLGSIMVVGDDIVFTGGVRNSSSRAYAERHEQLFGSKTTAILGGLTARIGLGTEVIPIAKALGTREAILALAQCDLVFGCVDSHDGRRILNRLSRYYLLPYFDCGVSLDADGAGGIEKIIAASHYFQPGSSSALDRKVINQGRADAESMARRDPEEYAKLHVEGYLKGVNEDRPAVIGVNAMAAGLAVNDMLARLHPYRYAKNGQYASVRFDLTDMSLDLESEPGVATGTPPHGRGDVEPLLEMSDLFAA